MKALIIAAVASTTAVEPIPIEFCIGIGNTSQAIMEARQMEVPISEVMSIFPDQDANDQFYREVIIEAYEEPAYLSSEAQQRAISRFRNTWETECFKASAN